MMRIEWIGQTLASLFWIVSVFAYGGPEGLGDWLQLMGHLLGCCLTSLQ